MAAQQPARASPVRRARPQTFHGRRFVSKGFKKGKRELGSIKWLLGKCGNGFFNFDGVQVLGLPSFALTLATWIEVCTLRNTRYGIIHTGKLILNDTPSTRERLA